MCKVRAASVRLRRRAALPVACPRVTARGHVAGRVPARLAYPARVEAAEQAHAKQLIITHHNPDYNDIFLYDIATQCQACFPNAVLAGEKLEVVIHTHSALLFPQ